MAATAKQRSKLHKTINGAVKDAKKQITDGTVIGDTYSSVLYPHEGVVAEVVVQWWLRDAETFEPLEGE